MRRAILLLAFVVGMMGCKSDAPMADPFSSHPIVPPPATGACPASSYDPAYAPGVPPVQNPIIWPTVPANNGSLSAPGAPAPTYSGMGSAGTNPAQGTTSGAWNAAGASAQRPPSANSNSTVPAQPASVMAPRANTNGSLVNGNPAYGNAGYGVTGTAGAGSPAPGAYPASTPASGYPNYGNSTPTLIPPPGTASPGGYPSGAASPAATNPGPGPATTMTPPADNRYGLPGSMNSPRGMPPSPTLPNTPIAGTPRPTPTRAASTIARPAAAIPGAAADYRSPRPVDDTAQPIRSSSAPYPNVLPNSTTTNPLPNANRAPAGGVSAAQPGVASMTVSQPRQMPMAPTAYGSPLAAAPYRPTIQTLNLDWQPCDALPDEGE